MSKEKKLNEYVEDRLDAYAGGEDSLARLKAVQAANAPEKRQVPWRRYVRMIATSFTVLVVVVVGVLFAMQTFAGGASSDSEVVGDGANEAVRFDDAIVAPNGKAIGNVEKTPAYENVDVNAEMKYLRLIIPAAGTLEKVSTEEGYYYTLTLADGTFDAVIAFKGATTEDTSFTTNKESTVAGLPFAYSYDISLKGKIVTDCETIYITHCAGEDETDALDAVRAVFTDK